MDKVSLVREGLRRFNAGDEEGMFELLHPDIEVWATDEALNSGTFKGREGIERWFQESHDVWDRIEYEPLEFIDVSDTILVVAVRVNAATRGAEVNQEVAWLFDIEDGLAKHWELHADRDAALASAKVWLAGQTRR